MKIKIGIIGGGFSGAMLARHLLNSEQNIEIYIFNNDAKFGRGIAYQAQIDSLLLNVPAGKMSAYSNQPDHFVDWLNKKNKKSKDEKAFKLLIDKFSIENLLKLVVVDPVIICIY